MKKILILSLLFLFSCSGVEKDAENSDRNVLFDSGKNSESKENIKQICDSIKIGESLEEVEKKFGKPTLLSETSSENIEYSSYYYGELGNETCLFIIEDKKINTKQYIK